MLKLGKGGGSKGGGGGKTGTTKPKKEVAPKRKAAPKVESKGAERKQTKGGATGGAKAKDGPKGGARKRKAAEATTKDSATSRPKREVKRGTKRKVEAANGTGDDGSPDFESFAFGR